MSRNNKYKGRSTTETTASLTSSNFNITNNICELIDTNNLKWLYNISCSNRIS